MLGGGRVFGWSGAACVLALLGGAPASALVITPTYDTTVTSSPDKTQIENSFQTILNQFEALYVNNVTVNVTLALSGSVGLGENVTFQTGATPYSSGTGNFVTALTSTVNGATTTNGPGQTALANLPATASAINSSDTGNGGNGTISLSTPNARAIGLSAPEASDSTILINPNPFVGFATQFQRVDGHVATNNYDFFATAEHELDEVLGLGSALACPPANCTAATPLPTDIRPEDLFRYQQNSTSFSFTYAVPSSAVAFLSINGGVSDLIQLSQDPGGDYGDFYSPGPDETGAVCTAIVQDAFGCNGQVASVQHNSVEAQLLNAMGWNPRFTTAASNTVWQVDCSGGHIASTGVVVTASTPVTNPLSSLLGKPSGPGTFTALPVAGDIIEITGICIDDVTVRTSDLAITNHAGPDGTAGDVGDGDGVRGQFEIASAQQITISGLLFGDFSGGFSFASGTDLATFFVHDGATVVAVHSDVVNSPGYGMLARRDAQVTLLDDRFIFNGFSSGTPNVGVLTNSRVVFGADDGSLSVLVDGSGGDGVLVSIGGSVIFNAANVAGNGGHQISLQGGSSARLSSSNVTVGLLDVENSNDPCSTEHGVACLSAIEATGSSTVRIENGATVDASTDSGSVVSAVVVNQGSALLAHAASLLSAATAPSTVSATENSVIALAGGNTFCSGGCTASTTGNVVVLDHVSTLIQVAASLFGYTAAQDALFGNATVQLQSTVDLGLGLISSAPGLAWTLQNTPNNGITVAQNSSFRLQGGTTFSNSGGIQLEQGSNGFFNTSAGGTNVVSGGVICPFTNIASAHVVAPNTNALNPIPPIATSFDSANAALHQCLPF
jgi:hypothetical protein